MLAARRGLYRFCLVSDWLIVVLGKCQSYLTKMLIRKADVNEITSRHRQLNLVCPRFKRATEDSGILSASTSSLWNMLPAHIDGQPNLTSSRAFYHVNI